MSSVPHHVGSPDADLPRLTYIGEIPVSSTVASSALIYRLLLDYPSHKLQILQSNLLPLPDQYTRLPGVKYEAFFQSFRRPLSMRGARHYRRIMLATAPVMGHLVAKQIEKRGWRPDAILTVAH